MLRSRVLGEFHILLIVVLLLAALFAGPANAREPGECRGADMMTEMAKRAPEQHKEIAVERDRTANGKALLWRIERDGVAVSHLFGTIHLTDTRVTSFSPRVLAAIEGSKRVVLEVADFAPEAIAKAMAKLSSLLLLRDGKRLDQLVDSSEFATVKAVLQRSGVPGEAAAAFQPWVIMSMMSLSHCEQQRVAKGIATVDGRIGELARKSGRPVVGLETIEDQLRAMAAVPMTDQVSMLRVAVKLYPRLDDMMETIVQLYLKREIAAAWPLQRVLAREAKVGPVSLAAFKHQLLTVRNRRMHDAALPILAQGGAFIAVGALHLVGDDGLVATLRAAGYRVTAVE
ncbi:MAG: TraB/GumN family protein [Hyphomicrobiaceae bacterium]|nr:TraB/GumN family protein [Hyphomicrobiaceae bacterium]